MIVDDNDELSEFAAFVVEDMGHAVVQAQDGPSAMAILQGVTLLDMLFTDIMLPGGFDGFELARRAKALRPGLKIIYATGYSEHHVDGKAGALFGPILGKPYRPGISRRKLSGCSVATPIPEHEGP